MFHGSRDGGQPAMHFQKPRGELPVADVGRPDNQTVSLRQATLDFLLPAIRINMYGAQGPSAQLAEALADVIRTAYCGRAELALAGE